MKIAHCSDLHIGYRRYHRLTPTGVNQREQDVADAFDRTVRAIIAEAPDVVLVAGDVFHSPSPSVAAILTMYAGFAEIRRALPSALVVVVSGNHDLSPARDKACALQLLTNLGVTVADRSARHLRFPSRELAVLAVPECAAADVPLAPDADSRYNLLVIHGEVMGVIPGHTDAARCIDRDALLDPRWDYVALGHYHTRTEIGPRAWYSGATESTSSNPWAEIGEPRGFVVVDTDFPDEAPRLVPVPGARRYLDLPRLDGTAMSPAEIDAAIAERLAGVDVAGACVRLVLDVAHREVKRTLDHRALRTVRADALDFLLDVRVARTERIGALAPSAVPMPDEPADDQDLIGTEPLESLPERPSKAGDALVAKLFAGCSLSAADYAQMGAVSRDYMGDEDIVAEVAA